MIKGNKRLMYKAYNAWKVSDDWSIWDVYASVSENKIKAWYALMEWVKVLDGKDVRILSYNTFTYTVGFIADDRFYYITKDYNRYIYLSVIDEMEDNW